MKFKLKLLKTCKLDGQLVAIGTIIELEDQAEVDALVAQGAGELVEEKTAPTNPNPNPDTPTDTAEVIALRAENLRIKNELEAAKRRPAATKKFEIISDNSPDPNRFKSLGEQLMAVFNIENNRGEDSRLKAATGLNESVGADGGFLVQTDFVNELLTRTYESAVLASRVRRIPITTQSNNMSINGVDETSRKDGSRWGGVRAYWADEAETKTGSQPKFRRINLKLSKLIGLCYVTDELLQDAPAMESYMSQAFQDEFAFKIDDAILRGTGAGQPLGIFNSPAKIAVPKETSQAAASILFANVRKMRSRLWARSRANSIWLINQDAEEQLQAMYIGFRNVAGTENVGGAPVYMPAGGVSGNGFDTLYGRPVIPIEQADTLGQEGDLSLVDMSQYLMIDKGGIQQATSIHVRFVNDETAFRFVYRVDGQPMWNSALIPYKGTITQAPFITLAVRA